MGEKIGILATSKDIKRIDFNADVANLTLKNKIKWEVKPFDDSSIKKVMALSSKNPGKTVDYCVSLDGDVLKFFARVGSDRVLHFSQLLSSIKPHDKRLTILTNLKSYSVTDDALINAYKERDPMD
jgi:hypothetical protein